MVTQPTPQRRWLRPWLLFLALFVWLLLVVTVVRYADLIDNARVCW